MSFITETDKQFVANTYARFPVELVSGKGSIVVDSDGKEYIDMGSGIAVTSFGLADDEWANAVTAQLTRLQHTSNKKFKRKKGWLKITQRGTEDISELKKFTSLHKEHEEQ